MVPSQNEKDLWFCYTLVGWGIRRWGASSVSIGRTVKIAKIIGQQNKKGIFLKKKDTDRLIGAWATIGSDIE